jgi:hypothetical protein
MKRTITVVTVLACLFCFFGCGRGAVDMKLKYEVGKRYHQRIIIAQDQTMNMGERTMDMSMQQTQDVSLSVLRAREEGGYEIEMEWRSMAIHMNMGLMAISYDSNNPNDANNPLVDSIGLLVGSTVLFTLDASNRIESVSGMESLMKKVMELEDLQAIGMFKQMFSDDALKQMINQGMAQGLPDHAVTVGDTWPYSADMPMGTMGTIHVKADYRFDGWEEHDGHRCALLTHTGTISMDPSSGSNPMGITMSITEGDSAGKTWFDPALGQAVEIEATQNMQLNLSGETFSGTSKINQVIKHTLLEVTAI